MLISGHSKAKGRENADRVGKLIQKVADNRGFSASRRNWKDGMQENHAGESVDEDEKVKVNNAHVGGAQGRNGVESWHGLFFPIRKIRCKGVNFRVCLWFHIENSSFFWANH